MSALELFNYSGLTVRTLIIDGEPWFILNDLCVVLKISNPYNVASRVSEDALRQTEVIDSMGRAQQMSIVSEAGMYEVVIRSDKPQAEQFRWWLTHEVIPQIRKTGSYGVAKLEGPALVAAALIEAQKIIEQSQAQVEALTPRAEAWDELASADGDYEVADAAKILARAGIDTGRQRLFEQLHEVTWIYRGPSGKWKCRQTAVDAGYLAEKPQSHHHPRTGELVLDPPQVRVTVKGLERLRVRLGHVLQLVESA